ncbi:MAG: hypothetical protein JWN59_1488 [Sphingomonas bacterium]|nr:hypothetical protein [Sphingomonas bacterium]
MWLGVAPLGLLAAALIATVAASPLAADPRVPTPPARAAFAWSLDQVRALIGAIGEARRHGLDPATYGIAALRAELDLCEELWNTPGSRQLDTLARTAALALANEYRRVAAAQRGPVQPAELDAALAAGRVGIWLSEMAPNDGRNG